MSKRGSLFNSVRVRKPKRNTFDLSYENKVSCNMGDLVPVFLKEVVPGDTFRNTTEIYMKFAPLISPVMHRINVYTHFFFVPNRLVWNHWEDFITGGEKGDFVIPPPQIKVGGPSEQPSFMKTYLGNGSLADYLGIPYIQDMSKMFGFSALPFRAYQLIYNEYYRDQNLQEPVAFSLGDSVTSSQRTALMTLRRRAWEKDYFTSALPFAQKGEPVPIDITSGASTVTFRANGNPGIWRLANGASWTASNLQGQPEVQLNNHGFSVGLGDSVPRGASFVEGPPTSSGGRTFDAVAYDPNGTLNAQLNDVNFTVNQLREANALQRWLEAAARFGSRYKEIILGHFGVVSPDSRLDRPEYLGGGKSPVQIGEVLQSSASVDGQTAQGNPAGTASAVSVTHQFTKTFTEHGYIIGIMSVMPRTAYQQGLPRHFQRTLREDYYWPLYAHLGEQEVYNSELYATPENINDKSGFGYQARYAEYKYSPSEVHGEFRGSLDYWHLGRIFANQPQLNEQFIKFQPDNRIWAVNSGPDGNEIVEHLYVQLYHNCRALRPMPKFGTPWF